MFIMYSFIIFHWLALSSAYVREEGTSPSRRMNWYQRQTNVNSGGTNASYTGGVAILLAR